MADRVTNRSQGENEENTARKKKTRDGSTDRKMKGRSSKEEREEEAEQRKKELEASIRLQVAAEEKAHKIVEKLVLDECVPEEFLLTSGNFFTPSHYSDVTQERSIAHICGYPLCSNPLTQISKQKYKISTKSNRVYDITERKCFCSNFCFKASKWFESQLLSSPVWARALNEPNELTLLRTRDETVCDTPSAGEIFIGSSITQPLESLCSVIDDPPFPSRDEGGLYEGFEHIQISPQDANTQIKDLAANVINPPCLPQEERTSESADRTPLTDNSSPTCVATQRDSHERSNQVSLLEELPSSERNRATVANDPREKILLRSVKQVVCEWCTAATLRFLGCEQSCRPDEDSVETSEGLQFTQKHSLVSESFSKRALSFFQANYDNEDYLDEDGLDSASNELSSENIVIEERQIAREEETMCVVPPIDSKSQMTIRRRIVLGRLSQTFPNVLREVKLTMGEISADLTQLVHTFSLGSHNITLKPVQWNILCLVLLEILRHKNLLVVAALDSAKEECETLVSRLGLTWQDLDNITAVFRPASGDETGNRCSRISRRGEQPTKTTELPSAVHFGAMEELD